MVDTSSGSGSTDAADDRYAGFARCGAGLEISIDGKSFTNTILSVRLHQKVNDHDRLEAFVVGDLEDQTGVKGLKPGDAAKMLGKSLTVTIWDRLQGSAEDAKALSWTGPVTDIRFEHTFDAQAVIVLVAASPSVALDSGKRNAVYTDQDAADIVSNVVGKYSVPVGDKTARSSKFPFILQHNESDYDFLQRIAAVGGASVFYDGSKLQIAEPGKGGEVELTWGVNLGSFATNVGARPVSFTTVSRDYVKNSKTASKAYQKPSFTGEHESKSGEASDSMYPTPGFIEAAGEIDMASLDKILNHATKVAYADALECRGQSDVCEVKAGTNVKVVNVGNSGSFWLKEVKHVVEDGMYHNTFEGVSVGAAAPVPRRERPKGTEVQTAHVVDLDDPEKLGRIKIQFDWLDGDFDFWVRYASPHAGDGHGWYSRPEIGDEVLVAFELGVPDRPIVLGSVYNAKLKPAQDDTEKNDLKWFLTKSGHKIEFDDKDEKITIVTAKETCTILLDGKNKSISITAGGDLSIDGDNVTIKAKQKLTLQSGTDAQLKAGANLKVEASANLDAKASAMMNLKGAMINLN